MINNRQNGRRRGRGGSQVRNGGGGGGNGPDRGNRIDNRSRGNAAQLLEKYKNLARDMQTQGDRVMTEYYLQFADHYFRVLGESRQRFEDQNPQQQRRQRDDFDYDDGDDNDGMEPQRDDRQERAERQERPERQDRPERQERPEREPRDTRQEPQLEYALEGEPVRADEDRPPRRGRRPRRSETGETEIVASPRIDVDRLPPAFSGEPEPAQANGHAAGGDVAPVGDDEEAPVRRRRTRRPKAGDDGDSSVAA